MRSYPFPVTPFSISTALRKPVPALVLMLTLAGVAPTVQAEDSPTLKWVDSDIHALVSSPVIGPDSTVYVGTDYDGVSAVRPDGTLKWTFRTQGAVESTPAVGADGTVYFGDTLGTFHAVTPRGSLRWSYSTGASINSSPAIGNKGCIYFGSRDGFLYSLYPNGTLQWKCRTGSGQVDEHTNLSVTSPPVVGPDGTIYVTSMDSHVYAITPFGTRKWVFTTPYANWNSAPAVGADGVLYVGCNGNQFLAINPDGSLRWKTPIYGTGYSSPAVAADGTIYFGTANGESSRFYALNPDGSEKWQFQTGGSIESSPAIGSDGAVYFCGAGQNLYVLNPDGSLRSQYPMKALNLSCPALMPDGTVYVSTTGGLFAFQTDNAGYQSGSPWPAFSSTSTRSAMSGDIPDPVLHIVRGQVTMPDSTTLVDVEVSAEGLTTRTDDYGFYTFLLPDGSYTISFHVNSGAVPDSVEVKVEGADVFVDLYPPSKHLVRGRLVGRSGPLAGMSILAGSLTATTDPGGRFSFLLPEGVHTLEFEAGDRFFPAKREIVVGRTDITLGDLMLDELRWTFTVDENIQDPSGIGRDGTVFLISGLGSQACLQAVRPDGTSGGKYEIGSGMLRTPGVGDDGTLYLPTWGMLLALNPDLTLRWEFPVEEQGVGAAPAIGKDGSLYFGSNARVYALNPNGTLRWKFDVGDRAGCALSIGPDGAVYVPCSNGILYVLNPDGILKWTFATGAALFFAPSFSSDGTVFINSYDQFMYAINPDGTLRWKFNTDSAASSGVIIGNEGDLYFTCQNGMLFALHPDGSPKWKFPGADLGAIPWIYRPTGEIWTWKADCPLALNPADGTLVWAHNRPLGNPVAGPGGRLYLTANTIDYPRSGALYAIDMADPDSIAVSVDSDASGESVSPRPILLHLRPNRPNPFNPETTIEFSLSAAARVTVEVYNASGQLVQRIADARMPAGVHRVTWNGAAHASGAYLARVRAGSESAVDKMLLVK